MSRHTFLTSSSVFGDKTETIEIVSASDVDKLVDKKSKALMDKIDRMEQDYRKKIEDLEQNRKWLWENVDIIKKFLVGGEVMQAAEKMKGYSANQRNVLCDLDEARETRRRLDKLPDSCREIFGNVIKDCLTQKLETFGRQIGSLESQIARVDKTREEMLQSEKSQTSELDECRNLAQDRMGRASWFGRIITWFKRKDAMSVGSEAE